MPNTILQEIEKERERQIEIWGVQDFPVLTPQYYNSESFYMTDHYDLPTEHFAKHILEHRLNNDTLTYMDIFVEELCEAVSTQSDSAALRKELVQCAAVVVAMIEAIDRNGQ